jgi:hypothetical protein
MEKIFDIEFIERLGRLDAGMKAIKMHVDVACELSGKCSQEIIKLQEDYQSFLETKGN